MKDINNNFLITEESLIKNKEISNNMEGKTFHLHTHILYDIRTSFGNDDEIVYLEIGAFAGASSSLIASHPYKTKCFAIDLGKPIDKQVVVNNVNKFKNPESYFEYIQGSSMDEKIINEVYDKINYLNILFIDGDHSKRAVFSDFNNFSKLVKKGGYICFDDYLDFKYSPEVYGAVNEIVSLLNKDEYEIIGSLKYELTKKYTDMESNSIFIIKKL
jgi:hypothetical protein